MANFEITDGKGMIIPLPNGVSVSIQIGALNYCDNYYKGGFADYEKQKEDIKNNIFPTSKTCETAIIMPDGSLLDYKGDNVQGYQTPKDLLKTLDFASKIKT